MSEETARALDDARQAEAQQREETDRVKQELLDKIADELPPRITAYGKKIAHEQPDVTTKMGADGVKALRGDLDFGTEALADDVRRSADSINWTKDFNKREPVRTALFTYFYGARVNAIDAVLRRHGYDPTARSSGLHPHSLYEGDWFAPVTLALAKLLALQGQIRSAKEADDHDNVENLWGD